MVKRVEVATNGVGQHTPTQMNGAIENTENSVIQGNAEIVMKGQYNDGGAHDMMMGEHSEQLLLSKDPIE